MVEEAVKFVLEKLADAAIKKVFFLWEVRMKVKRMKEELNGIQAFLKDVDSNPLRDNRQRNWVKDVREVAYSIEDVIDNAVLLNDDIENESLPNQMEIPGCSYFPYNAVKKVLRKIKKIPTLHNLGVEIDQILAKMKQIEESRTRLGVNNIGEGSGGPGLRLPIRKITPPNFDDPNVVGFEENINDIVEQLLDESTHRRSVVSIVGTGGLGKTTLARKVYKRTEIKNKFKRVWVHVTREFKLVDLLKKIVKQFDTIDPSEYEEDEEYFVAKLHECCSGNKYLIVLDDVWTDDLWTQVLNTALPDENNASRVLITSRSDDVAQNADSRSEPYHLQSLNDNFSLKLLLQKALDDRYPNNSYPQDLLDLAKQFVKKCDGLPLAIEVLGGLLSKQSDYHAWNTLLQTMHWPKEGSKCLNILETSFEDLPLTLKYCFMYFSIFPEDSRIVADDLYRMWIAEGLIPEFEYKTLENTAESFLQDLVKRCLIQVAERSYNGSISHCRIHDHLRDLAIQKAKDDGFLMVFPSNIVDDQKNCFGARRLAIPHSNCDELTRCASKNLRSLLCFGPTPDCSKHRLLKVLKAENIALERLKGLTQLRYFEYHYNGVDDSTHFERFLCKMKYMQTLDLRFVSKHEDLPDCIWHVKTLRHILLSTDIRPSGPPSWADLRNLQTLIGIKSRISWATEGIPNVPNLRNLDVEIVEGLSWEVVADVVATLLDSLKLLLKLSLFVDDVPFKVLNMRNIPFCPDLEYLSIGGFYDGETVSFASIVFPIHLIHIHISNSELNYDPISILEKLPNLKMLFLHKLNYHMGKMRFSAQGFVRLELLEFFDVKFLEELEIEEGAMPMLRNLNIRKCPQLCVPLGLQRLPSLYQLEWNLTDENSPSRKEDEIASLCKGIPIIITWWESDDSDDSP